MSRLTRAKVAAAPTSHLQRLVMIAPVAERGRGRHRDAMGNVATARGTLLKAPIDDRTDLTVTAIIATRKTDAVI